MGYWTENIFGRTDCSHIFEMFDDANMRSGLYIFIHIVLLNDFGSFALCMSDKLIRFSPYFYRFSVVVILMVCGLIW